MKFKINKFLNILIHHQNILDKKSINSLFSCIKIENKNNITTVISTNRQTFLQNTIDSTQAEDFEIIINGHMLYEVLKKSSAEEFEIIIEDNQYLLKVEEAVLGFAIKKEETYDFWNSNENESKAKFSINSNILNQALKNIKWASSNEDSRPILNSVLFHIKNNSLSVCATDTLRLAVISDLEIKDLNVFEEENKFIVHKKAVNDLIKLLDNYEEDVVIDCSNFMKIIFNKNQTIWQTLITIGTFPNYEKLINLETLHSLEINKTNIANSIERLLIMGNQIQPSLLFEFNNEKTSVSCKNALSSGSDFIYGIYNGSKVSLSLNGRLLIELLNNLKGEIILNIKDPFSPIIIKEKDENNKTFIIAPVKNN